MSRTNNGLALPPKCSMGEWKATLSFGEHCFDHSVSFLFIKCRACGRKLVNCLVVIEMPREGLVSNEAPIICSNNAQAARTQLCWTRVLEALYKVCSAQYCASASLYAASFFSARSSDHLAIETARTIWGKMSQAQKAKTLENSERLNVLSSFGQH